MTIPATSPLIIPIWESYSIAHDLHAYSLNETPPAGFSDPAVAFWLYAQQCPGSVPVYRLSNPNGGQCYLTAALAEIGRLVLAGWINDGSVGFIMPVQTEDTSVVAHIYNMKSGDEYFPTWARAVAINSGAPLQFQIQKELGYAPDPAWYQPQTWPVVLFDDFLGSTLNSSNWSILGDPACLSVAGGSLRIGCYTNAVGVNQAGHVISPAILKPGTYVEARLWFHDIPGVFSGFWTTSPQLYANMLNGAAISPDPSIGGVEIDFSEAYDGLGKLIMQACAYWVNQAGLQSVKLVMPETLQDQWITVGCLLSPGGYTCYVNGQVVATFTKAVSGIAQAIRINNNFTPDVATVAPNGFGPASNPSAYLLVDSVTVRERP